MNPDPITLEQAPSTSGAGCDAVVDPDSAADTQAAAGTGAVDVETVLDLDTAADPQAAAKTGDVDVEAVHDPETAADPDTHVADDHAFAAAPVHGAAEPEAADREEAIASDLNPPVERRSTLDPGSVADQPAGPEASSAGGNGAATAPEPTIFDLDPATTPPATPEPETVPEHDLVGALEAVLLVVEAPVTDSALATAVGHRPARVRELLIKLAARYTAASSGIELRELGGGWRFYTRDRFAPVVERFVLDGAQSRLSRAALETLAVVAYRQPVTRSRVAGVRGVNVDGVIRTLMSRGLIEDVGADPDTGGLLYQTTDLFLERLGLSDLSELPSLGPLLPDIDGIEDV